MLTSEEVREIELRVAAGYACLDAPGFRDSLAARRDVAALFSDRAEMQAGIERLRAEYAQTLTTIATAISLTADIPNETAAALCRMCNRNLAALEGEA